jgi:4-hydroxyproline epimerase
MCGHGTIGIVETLRHLGRVGPGELRFDTPVGAVTTNLHENGEVEIQNVMSYRYLADVALEVEGVGKVVGDVAYGGNWFFVVESPHFPVDMTRTDELTAVCSAIGHALAEAGITGLDGAAIDHIELASFEAGLGANSRNFVQCPGGAYDRSPCGTGTSAKMACLFARGRLTPGEWYVQESVTGSRFRGRIAPTEGGVIPTIVGRAFVTGETTLLFRDDDPLRWGLEY